MIKGIKVLVLSMFIFSLAACGSSSSSSSSVPHPERMPAGAFDGETNATGDYDVIAIYNGGSGFLTDDLNLTTMQYSSTMFPGISLPMGGAATGEENCTKAIGYNTLTVSLPYMTVTGNAEAKCAMAEIKTNDSQVYDHYTNDSADPLSGYTWFYASDDVSVHGSNDVDFGQGQIYSYHVNIDVKSGWNIIKRSSTDEYTIYFDSVDEAPAGGKWYKIQLF